jgi:hypothetical protein
MGHGYPVMCVAKLETTPETKTLDDISTMQEMSFSVCENSVEGESNTLTDTRDSNSYTVKKLKDGNCWMTQSLKLVDKTITSGDSNLPEGESFTIPPSDISSFTTSSVTSAYLDPSYGAYYNYNTVTAGWSSTGTHSQGDFAPGDICPKGWRLSRTFHENDVMGMIYYNVSLLSGEPAMQLNGLLYNGEFKNRGSRGSYWTSTYYNNKVGYVLDISGTNGYAIFSNAITAANYAVAAGAQVRCIARMDI